jgi:hypothetical protein
MEQLPTEKKEKVQGESSFSSENESTLPIFADKLKVGESPNSLGSDTDLDIALPAILENEAEFDGSDLIAIPNNLKDAQLEALIRAKKYSKITDEQRRDFIDAVEVNGEKIINAAKRFNINYSSAKSILNVYKNEGRSIKKLTRNRGAKDSDEGGEDTQVGTEVRNPNDFQNDRDQLKPFMVTFDAATQTQSQEEPQGDNYLLALRDRLIASKTDKRENPYTSSVSHDFTRHAGNLGDYTQLQMTNGGYDNAFNIQTEVSRSQAAENKQVQFVGSSPYSSGQGGSPGQYVSPGDSNSQSQSYQQQQGSQQISFNPENRGIYSTNQQPSGSNYGSNQQPQTYTAQQDHKNQTQQYIIAQNNLDQQRLQSAAGSQNQLVNLGFSQPGTNNDFSGMSYTGTGQSQYFSDSASDSRNMMQGGQVQYLQPIMYLMPSNFSGMSGMNGMAGMAGMPGMPGMSNQNGFVPSGLQGLQSLQGLQNLGNLGNIMSLPNNFMLFNGQGQVQGQNQAGQSTQGNQNQSQSGQSQNQSNQNQGQSGQNQSQSQYQSQNYYQNQGPYFGSR